MALELHKFARTRLPRFQRTDRFVVLQSRSIVVVTLQQAKQVHTPRDVHIISRNASSLARVRMGKGFDILIVGFFGAPNIYIHFPRCRLLVLNSIPPPPPL